MKKSKVLCVVLCCVVLLAVLAGCSNSRIRFDAIQYIFYMDSEVRTMVPVVSTRPKAEDYTLSSRNPTIVRVLDDGVTIEALRVGTTVITATCAHGEATATVVVYDSPTSPDTPGETQEGFLVLFHTSYGSVPAQRVAPGETATRPSDPYRPGYRVVDWYLDTDLTKLYDFSTPVTAPLTLYPKWEAVPASFLYTYLSDTTASIKGLQFAEVPYEDLELPAVADGRTVVAIESGAFRKNTTILNVSIPDTVTKIGAYAFAECVNLRSVTGGESLAEIGEGAFWRDAEMTECPLPDTLTTLGGAAFSGCSAFSPATLPASLTILEQQLFESSGIKTVDLRGIKTVKKMCFYGSDLETITNTGDIETVESEAFYATPWMQAQYKAAPDHMIYLDDILLYLDYADQTDVTVKEGTRLIANYAFYHYRNLGKDLIIRLPSVPPTLAVVHNTTTNRDEVAIPAASVSTPITLAVPKESYQTYITTPIWSRFYIAPQDEPSSTLKNMYWWIDDPIDTLNVLVRHAPVTASVQNYVIVSRYTGEDEVFDLNTTLNAAYSKDYVVTRILMSAFYGRNNLTTLIMPAAVDAYERNCINDCLALRAMYIAPSENDKYPNRTQLYGYSNGRSWSVVNNQFAIYVSEKELANYRSAWYYDYAVTLFQGYTAEEFERVTGVLDKEA